MHNHHTLTKPSTKPSQKFWKPRPEYPQSLIRAHWLCNIRTQESSQSWSSHWSISADNYSRVQSIVQAGLCTLCTCFRVLRQLLQSRDIPILYLRWELDICKADVSGGKLNIECCSKDCNNFLCFKHSPATRMLKTYVQPEYTSHQQVLHDDSRIRDTSHTTRTVGIKRFRKDSVKDLV